MNLIRRSLQEYYTCTVDVKKVHKGWGYELWYINKKYVNRYSDDLPYRHDGYCGKLLYFTKGKKCSFHYHKNKHETFVVKKGSFRVILSLTDDPDSPDGWQTQLHEGSVLVIPPLLRHQMICNRIHDSEIIEFSTFHEDSDSYRVIKGD